jgi:histidinol dehydrogenase
VKIGGDAALFALTEKSDHQKLDSLRISQRDIDRDLQSFAPELMQVLIKAETCIIQPRDLQKSKTL